jgi:hypothetical protein
VDRVNPSSRTGRVKRRWRIGASSGRKKRSGRQGGCLPLGGLAIGALLNPSSRRGRVKRHAAAVLARCRTRQTRAWGVGIGWGNENGRPREGLSSAGRAAGTHAPYRHQHNHHVGKS